MKILWLNPWFGNYRLPVYEGLKKLTHDNFYLMAGTQEMDESLLEKLKVSLGEHCNINTSYKRLVIGNAYSNFANASIGIPVTRGVFRWLKKISPDIVIVDGFFQWCPIALLYCILFSKPLIIDYERTEYVERNSPKWRTFYRRIIGHFVSGYIVNGSLTIKYLKKLKLANVPIQEGCMAADTVFLRHQIVNYPQNERESLRAQYQTNNGLVYLFVGQFVERKGVAQMLEAWEKHVVSYPNDVLLMIGRGVLADMVNQKACSSIKVLGGIPYNEIYKYYAISDVFLMPTLEDNWSLVVPEAMACGLPVLTSIYNGCYPELVKNGENGFVFDPLDKDNFCTALSKVHNSDLEAMGKNSVKLQDNYTPEKASERIYQLCKQLLEK